jgi:hypothetical protein
MAAGCSGANPQVDTEEASNLLTVIATTNVQANTPDWKERRK